MSPNTSMDPCISYGRGGAGNMRRRSSILDAWAKISTQSSSAKPLSLVSSPDDHYASSKSERRVSSSSNRQRRTSSSLWSLSTAAASSGEKSRFGWKRLFRRASSDADESKIEESE